MIGSLALTAGRIDRRSLRPSSSTDSGTCLQPSSRSVGATFHRGVGATMWDVADPEDDADDDELLDAQRVYGDSLRDVDDDPRRSRKAGE